MAAFGVVQINAGAWLELAADVTKAATDRQICLGEVAKWIEIERAADLAATEDEGAQDAD